MTFTDAFANPSIGSAIRNLPKFHSHMHSRLALHVAHPMARATHFLPRDDMHWHEPHEHAHAERFESRITHPTDRLQEQCENVCTKSEHGFNCNWSITSHMTFMSHTNDMNTHHKNMASTPARCTLAVHIWNDLTHSKKRHSKHDMTLETHAYNPCKHNKHTQDHTKLITPQQERSQKKARTCTRAVHHMHDRILTTPYVPTTTPPHGEHICTAPHTHI